MQKFGMPHRVTVFGQPRAPWRATFAEAKQDAVRLDLASWDEEAGEHYLAVPVEIETRADPSSPDTKKGPATR